MKDRRPIGYYVHHQGSGHAAHARQIIAAWSNRRAVHVLTSATHLFSGKIAASLVALPPDISDDPDYPYELLNGLVYHYAPVGIPNLRRRMARISRWIAENNPALMIVDVSAEISQFCRLCGVPVVSVRLLGKRNDSAHRAAWGISAALLAPFPPRMDDRSLPAWVKDKTCYTGFLSRHADRPPLMPATARQKIGYASGAPLVVVVNGQGGGFHDLRYWQKVAAANPARQWCLLGKAPAADKDTLPANLRAVGFQPDTYPFLCAADIVIGSGGINTIAEVTRVGRPFIGIPEPRPFDEQRENIAALARNGVAILLPRLPQADDWSGPLEQARLTTTGQDQSSPSAGGLSDIIDRLEHVIAAQTITLHA